MTIFESCKTDLKGIVSVNQIVSALEEFKARLPFFLSPVYTQENFPWKDNFSLSCELPCATNGFKKKKFLSEENFPVRKRALIHPA